MQPRKVALSYKPLRSLEIRLRPPRKTHHKIREQPRLRRRLPKRLDAPRIEPRRIPPLHALEHLVRARLEREVEGRAQPPLRADQDVQEPVRQVGDLERGQPYPEIA